VVYVDEARCVGCGLCADACPTGAISVVDGVAKVEQSLCRECEACLEACPSGAILALREPAKAGVPAPVRTPAPTPIPVRPVVPASQSSSDVWPWLGAALGFVGREVVPRVAALLGNRGQQQPRPTLPSRVAGAPGRANYGGRGGGQRARRRRRGRW